MEKDYADFQAHQKHAPRAQAMQDKHLSEYREWVTQYLAKGNSLIIVPDGEKVDSTPEINDQYLFPNDWKRFCEHVGQ